MATDNNNLHDDLLSPFGGSGKQPFGMPSNYFQAFEDKLKRRLEAESELKECPLLSSISKESVFAVPTDFFTTSEQVVEQCLELSAYPALNSLEKSRMPDLEDSYSLALVELLEYRVSVLEELKPYEKLYMLDKVNAFTVNGDYFDSIADRVKTAIYAQPDAPVSVLDRLWIVLFGGRTAWAFGLALIVGLAVYFNGKEKQLTDSNDCKTLACLERSEILDSKAITNLDEEQLMDLVDVNSLKKQLNLDVSQQDSLTSDTQMQDISDDELLDVL